MSRRTERVGSAIREEIARVIVRELSDPRLDGTLPSVNRVKVADDLSVADIYMVFMGTPGKQTAALAALQHAAGMMRSRVGKALATRTVPYLRFHIDESYQKEMAVLDLIRKAAQELPPDPPPAESGEAGDAPGGDPEAHDGAREAGV